MRFLAGTTTNPASRRIRLVQPFRIVSLTTQEELRAISGTPSSVEVDDAIFSRTVSNAVTDFQITPQTIGGGVGDVVSYQSSNQARATVNNAGKVTHVSDGAVTITAFAHGNPTEAPLTMATQSGATTDVLTSYVAGSLAADATDAVDGRIAGKSPATAWNIFLSQNHSTPAYVRNTQCWAADLDLTPISPWNNVSGNTLGITAIAPDIVIGAAHAFPFQGATVRFVAADNTIITRTITATRTHPDYVPYYPDIAIGILNSPLPSSISFVKFLPSDYSDYLPELAWPRTLPCLCLDQEEKALVTDLGELRDTNRAIFVSPSSLNSQQRNLFYETKTSGDSGNPAFLIINDELVLVTAWTYGGPGSGTFMTPFLSAINTMMSQLGSSNSVTTVDLSSFNSY